MSNSETTPNYTRFDRHKIFDEQDRNLVLHLTCITKSELQNKLPGLFDGYLYNDLLALAKIQLPEEELDYLKKLIAKIKNH